MVVDYQTHWYPPAYLDWIEGRARTPRTHRADGGYRYEGVGADARFLEPRFFDLDVQLADMDQHGIDVMVSSPNLVGEVDQLELAEARETAELLNEEHARAQRAHPDRFVGLAMLPMQDAAAAIEVLDRAVGQLGLSGVCILSHIAGDQIATAATRPVYERIEQLGVPIFLHPAHRSSVYRPGDSRPLESGLNWVYDTSRAALSLILSGTLDACPGLRVVHPHTGGVLPFVLDRIAFTTQANSTLVEGNPQLELPFAQYLRDRFYVDSVNQTRAGLRLAIETYGVDRILCATDYPWQARGARLEDIKATASAPELRRILYENAPPGLALPGGSRTERTASRDAD